MPKIVDPDNLSRNVSVIWDVASPTARTIGISSSLDSPSSLIPPLASGSDSGVSFQALYSFAKEQWKNETDLIKIPFPFISITKNQFDIQNNWNFVDDKSRYLVRDGGWSVISASITTEEWLNIRTLGTLGFDATNPALSDQVYYQQSGSALAGSTAETINNTAQNFVMSGSVNQAVLHYSASDSVVERNFRGFTKLYVREYKKIYDDASIQDDLGVVTQEYTQYSVPLQNSVDLKIQTDTENSASVLSPWRDVNLYFFTGSGYTAHPDAPATLPAGYVASGSDGEWYITNGGGTKGADSDLSDGSDGTITDWVPYVHVTAESTGISGSYAISSTTLFSPFNVVITNGTGSAAQTGSISDVYTSVQYKLRQNTDIDDGTMAAPNTYIGKTTRLLLSFVGDTLVTANGVYVLNYQDADTNSIDFYDVSGSVARYPFVATGTITFNDNLRNEGTGNAEYFMFFTSVPSGDFGTTNAVIVNDNAGLPITGSVNGAASVPFTFDYDGNTQGGRSSGANAAVTVVAIGLGTAQYVSTTSVIARTKVNNISLVAGLERNYDNPA